jgi:predicted PurR-regulated permease PerM
MMAIGKEQQRGSWWPVVISIGIVIAGLYMIRSTLPPMILAGIMAYLLNPVVDIGERHSLPRWVAIVIIYVFIGALIVLGVFYLVPAFIHQVQEIQRELTDLWPRIPTYLNAAVSWIRERFPSATSMLIGDDQLGMKIVTGAQEWLGGTLARAPKLLTSVLSNVVNFLLYFVMVPFIAFFLLRDGRSFVRSMILLIPNQYFETTLSVLGGIGEAVGRYLRGLLIQAMILASIATIGLMITGLKYPVMIGVIAGIANVVPYIGPAIGIVAGITIAVTTNTGSLIGVLIVFGAAQFIDNWFVAPVVMSRSVSLHPLIVFLAVILGGTYAGTLGMFLAIPVTGAGVVCIKRLREGLRPPVQTRID